MPDQIRQIALFLPPTPGYLSDVVLGVQQYARASGNWAVEVCHSVEIAEASVRNWRPDGVLLNALDGDWTPLVTRLGLPTVQIGGQTIRGLPQVRTDNAAIGELAAGYFLERGFRQFAYIGYAYLDWAVQRRDAFVETLSRRGYACDVFDGARDQIHVRHITGLIARWVRSLAPQTAIFACHDRAAMIVGHACRHAGIDVPDALAILGVDNNAFECGFTEPPISSIVGSARRIGYQAAALLEQLIRGGEVDTPGNTLVRPARVETRASTDVFAVNDPDVAAALTYIDAHAEEMLTVEQVARAVFASRRMLGRKFRSLLHQSPRERILRAHIEQAKRLLIKTDLSMLEVAVRSGFPSGSKFSAVFKRETHISPNNFRRLYGTATPGARPTSIDE